MRRPAVAYCRVSTEGQAREDRSSLADQTAALATVAARLGATITATFSDPGVSGRTANRPGFRALVAYCEATPQPVDAPGLVLALNASRWGRFGPDEAAYWRHHLARHGWSVRYAEGDTDDDSLAQPILRAVTAAEAAQYARQLSANTQRGKAGTAAAGFWNGQEPVGYRRAAVDPTTRAVREVLGLGERKRDGDRIVLVPDPVEAPVVRDLFLRYAAGTASLGDLTATLRAAIPRRRWSRTAASDLLTNVAYLGHVAHRGVVVAPHAHAALVDADTFARVAARLAEARARLRRRPAESRYLLTGLVTCAVCGAHYTGGGSAHTTRQGAPLWRFYRDAGGDRGLCARPMGTIAQPALEGAVVAVVSDVLRDPATADAIRRAVTAALAARATPTGPTPAQRRATAEAQIARLTAAIADGVLSPAEAAPGLSAARVALAAAERDRARPTPDPAADVEALVALATDLPAVLARAAAHGVSAMRAVLAPWLDAVIYDKRTRRLTVRVRALPASGLSGPPGQGGQPDVVVTRTVRLTSRGIAA